MEWSDEIKGKVEKLESKYASSGQDLGSYLDGLLYTNPLYYWDYTFVDTLVKLYSILRLIFLMKKSLSYTIKLQSYISN